MHMKNTTLHQQQLHLQAPRAIQNPVSTQVIRDSGEKLAGHLNGDTVNFAKILVSEHEKQRRLQELRHSGREELKQIQPLL